jgi:NifU-like protein
MKWTRPFPWTLYSKKLKAKIFSPRNGGQFTHDFAKSRNLRLALGKAGEKEDGNLLQFYWLVDRDDGVIVDAKFQVFGQTALIGAADAACDILPGKNYDQAKRISADLIDRHLRDRQEEPAFPKETYPHLNLVLSAIEEAADGCLDLPLPKEYLAPPAPREIGEVLEGGYPGWQTLSLNQKMQVIEQVLDQEIRPYIALDGGGVELINLLNDQEVIIAYQGNCTSCFSSVGATLSFIQQVIKAKVHPDLKVTPNLA